jgi:hypothetical protein
VVRWTPYQKAVRLSAVAASNWERIDGFYAGKGVNILDLPFSRFLSVVYVWATERMSSEDAEKFDQELLKPLRGQELTEDDRQLELEQLRQFDISF